MDGTTVLIGLLIRWPKSALVTSRVWQCEARDSDRNRWFTLFQTHWFLGLRNLGLLNFIAAVLLAPTVLAIYCAIRRDHMAYGAFGTILSFVGLAVYFSSSWALPKLSLSGPYASATTEQQRTLSIARCLPRDEAAQALSP